MSKEYQDVKIQRLPTKGKPLSNRTSKWKPALNVSNEDLKALKKVIKASEKNGKKNEQIEKL